MIHLEAAIAVVFCAAILTLVMLRLGLGSQGFSDIISDCRRNLSLSRFGMRQMFAATAILATVMALLRGLHLVESWLDCLVFGVCLAPFAVGIVYFVALVFSDVADTLSPLHPLEHDEDDEANDDPPEPNDE